MSKIVALNLGNFGSTGTIAREIGEYAINSGFEYHFFIPGNSLNKKLKKNEKLLCSDLYRRINQKISYLTGYNGCFSFFSTLKLIRHLNKIRPDIVHLHNIHNSYVNFYLLARYLKKHKIKTVWTFHDCWAFTGLCPYFDMVNCSKWQTQCSDCPNLNRYPFSKVDRTKYLFQKKHIFSDLDLTIVCPSVWMANNVRKSFLKEKQIMVINNGIDISVFAPQSTDLRKKFNCENKIVLLGVAFDWDVRKGLDVFKFLSNELDEHYVIVLIGVSSALAKELPPKIICVDRTKDQHELAAFYSMADALINPTREDNYPTVNMEALSCGLPVISFDTGGSAEIFDSDSGIVIKKDDMNELLCKIRSFKGKNFYTINCLAQSKNFDKKGKYLEYIDLYNKLIGAE